MTPHPFWKQPTYFLPLIFTVLLIALYYAGLSGPFIFDDVANISPALMQGWNWSEFLARAGSNGSGILGRPLSIMSFSLTSLWLGDNSIHFKSVNLLLHIINGGLIYLLVRKLQFSLVLDKTLPHYIAWLIAAFWLLHPLQVSTVLYSVQRMTELSSLFSLLSLLCYLNWRSSTALPLLNRASQALLSLLFFLAALYSKENGVLILAYIAAIELTVFHQDTKPNPGHDQFVRIPKQLLLGAILLGVIAFYIALPTLLSGYGGRDFSWLQRLYTQAHVLFLYLQQIFLPSLLNLSFFHDDFAVQRTLDVATSIKAAILLAGLLAACIVKSLPAYVRFGILWFFAGHLLESTIVPLEMVWEHRNYLALLGPMTIVVVGLHELGGKLTQPRLPVWLFAGIGFWLCLTTGLRASIWGDEAELALHLASEHAASERAQSNLAEIYIKYQQPGAAIDLLERTAALNPGNSNLLIQSLAYRCNQPAPPAIVAGLQNNFQSAYLDNQNVTALARYVNIALAGNCQSITLDNGIQFVEAGFENHTLEQQLEQRSILFFLQGRMLAANGQTAAALAAYDDAFAIDPSDRPWRILAEKARLYVQLQQLERAREQVALIEALPAGKQQPRLIYSRVIAELKALL